MDQFSSVAGVIPKNTEELGQKAETSLDKDTADSVPAVSIGAARMHATILPSF